jgi:hypothetical protein
MPATVTVTGKAGPGNTVTAEVFENVTNFSFATENNILTIVQGAKTLAFDINDATTITATKSGTTYTLVVS